MDKNSIFQDHEKLTANEYDKKSLDTVALVLGIVAIVASIFIPIVSYVCGIIGLIFAIKHRKVMRTRVALILCIVGILCGLIFHAYFTMVMLETMKNVI